MGWKMDDELARYERSYQNAIADAFAQMDRLDDVGWLALTSAFREASYAVDAFWAAKAKREAPDSEFFA